MPRCDASRDCWSPRQPLPPASRRSASSGAGGHTQIILLDGMYALIGLGSVLLSLRAARLVEAGPTPRNTHSTWPRIYRPRRSRFRVCPPTLRATQASRVLVTVRTPGDWSVRRKKILVRQYARAVDDALRPLLRGDERPLILIAPQPINAIFRSVCSYPYLLDADLQSSGDRMTETEIAEAVQPLLADAEEQRRAQLAELLDQRRSQNRVLEDLADIARAATAGPWTPNRRPRRQRVRQSRRSGQPDSG